MTKELGALECLEALEQDIKDRIILAEDGQLKLCAVIKQALLKAEKEHKALEIIKKHFIIRMSEEAELNGNVWGRLVRIQSKEDEGTWDTTAIANIVDYKEDFDLLKEVLEWKDVITAFIILQEVFVAFAEQTII